MGLTTGEIIRVLAVCCRETPDSPAEAVTLVRQSQPSLAATLFSAWQAEGTELDLSLRHELDLAAARMAYYRALAARLSSDIPHLMPIKGIEVANLYPDGFVRAMNDLDYVAVDEADLWRATALLTAEGWELHTATFCRLAGVLHVVVSLRHAHESPFVLPYGVEIATYPAVGDHGGVPALAYVAQPWTVPAVKNTLMLLYERFEQPYRARDIVDAVLLFGSATPGDVATIVSAVAQLGLQPELAELAGLVAAAGLVPLPVPSYPAATVAAVRARRLARAVGLLRRPLGGAARLLQRRLIAGQLGRLGTRAWAGARRAVSVDAALHAGLLAFGLPLEGTAQPVAAATLHQRDGSAWVDTPVARFVLTVGDDVDESVVEELSRPDPMVVPPAAEPGPAADLEEAEPVELSR